MIIKSSAIWIYHILFLLYIGVVSVDWELETLRLDASDMLNCWLQLSEKTEER